MSHKLADVATQLLPHQQRVVDRMRRADQTGLVVAHGLGSGKTLTSIAAQDALGMPASVVLPAALQENYQKEREKHLTGDMQPIDMTTLQAVARRGEAPPGQMLIIDEAHRIRDPSTKGSQAMRRAEAQKRMLLTATPFYNKASDIAPLINVAAGYSALPVSPQEFYSRYVTEKEVKPGWWGRTFRGETPGSVEMVNPAKAPELRQVFGKYVDYHPSSTEGFPTVERKDVKVQMTPEQLKVYDTLMSQAPPWVAAKIKSGLPPSKQESKDLNAFLGGVRQASNTTAAYNPDATAYQPKIEQAFKSLQQHLGENERAKAVVYSNYLDSGLKPYAGMLDAAGVPYGMFTGDQKKKDRDQMVRDYNEGKLRALLLSSAGGEGLDLKGTRLMQVLDPHWNEEKLRQVEGRGIRYGSHADLPEEERKVRLERYLATRPRAGLLEKMHLKDPGGGVDEYLANLSGEKDRLHEQFRQLLPGYEKTSASRLRSMFNLVPLAEGAGYEARLGEDVIGHLKLRNSYTPGSSLPAVAHSEIKPEFRGMGLGRKMYGEVMRRLPGGALESGASVSPEAQGVWHRMMGNKGYSVKVNPDAVSFEYAPGKFQTMIDRNVANEEFGKRMAGEPYRSIPPTLFSGRIKQAKTAAAPRDKEAELAEDGEHKLQGRLTFQGLPVAVENRKGSVRSGVDKDGHKWRTVMKHPYGYIKGTKGKDGEEVDAYVGPDKKAPHAFVVHQHKENGKGFDEDKVMLGFSSKKDAREAYLAHYDDPKYLGPISTVPVEELKKRVESKERLEKISAVYSLWKIGEEKTALTRAQKEWHRLRQAGDVAGSDQIAQGYGQLGLAPRQLENVSGGGMEASVDRMMGMKQGPVDTGRGYLARKIYKPDTPVVRPEDMGHYLQQKQRATDVSRSISPEARQMMPAMYGSQQRAGGHETYHEFVEGARPLQQGERAAATTQVQRGLVQPAQQRGVSLKDLPEFGQQGQVRGNVSNVMMTPSGPKAMDFIPQEAGGFNPATMSSTGTRLESATGAGGTSYGYGSKANVPKLRRDVYGAARPVQAPAVHAPSGVSEVTTAVARKVPAAPAQEAATAVARKLPAAAPAQEAATAVARKIPKIPVPHMPTTAVARKPMQAIGKVLGKVASASLQVPKVKQLPVSCGPASLLAVLKYHKLDADQEEVAKRAGTDKDGTELAGMLSAIKSFGFDGGSKDNASFADLRKELAEGRPVIVHWWSEDDSHYSVVRRVSDDKIYLMDPFGRHDKTFDKDVFDRNWFAFDRKGKSFKRRMITLRPAVKNSAAA